MLPYSPGLTHLLTRSPVTFSGPIIRYFVLPLGVERLAVADIEALKDINLRYPYRFAKPRWAINWMKPVLGEKGILLVIY